ncbi:MAG: FecR domain-containing protein, partial [Nitrospiraceae bacterium]
MKQFLIMSVSSALLLSAQMLITNAAFAEVTCEQWAGKAVKVQGDVMVRRSSTGEESPLRLNDVLCPGDMITVSKHGRAGIQLPARTLAQLDQGTSLIFTEPEKAEFSLINILRGIVHFMSRTPQTLEVKTPFVNAGVEGTEFVISVLGTETLLTVFEGTIRAHNDLGPMIIEKGQSARARTGEPPEPYTVARPRDSVRWALYYLPLYDLSEADIPDEGAPWQSALRESVSHFREGDLSKAFMSLDPIQESVPDHRFYLYRASLLLAVGRVDEAEEDLSRVLGMREENSDALALQSVIAVAQNDKEQAMSLAGRAAAADPRSTTAQMAMSYVLQSKLDLKGALMSSKNAVAFEPENSLAWARLAEMHQSFGELDRALEAAEKAAALNPRLSRTQTVLGYSYLTQVKTGDARDAFEQAIVLDQADPLPWMGLGLAKIREGKLEEGRSDLEVAAVLDPGNSLARSYLGKAYYEEKEEDFAGDQYAMARELDPKDPTPFFYDAIRKQSMNRPVEALKDMQKAIALNDNRAIYRSKLLLDEDLAARSAAQARIYSDLGFQQLALVEGWKSVNTDPGNYAAHRFLADSYSKLPR